MTFQLLINAPNNSIEGNLIMFCRKYGNKIKERDSVANVIYYKIYQQ